MHGVLRTCVAVFVLVGCSDPDDPQPSCEPNCVTEDDPDGDGAIADDCAPEDGALHPGAVEVCDGLDNNCDGMIDNGAADATIWYADGDGDGYGVMAQTTTACQQPMNTAAAAGDCNDANSSIHPNAAEIDCADATDYNCDGSSGFADADADGAPACMDCDDADSKRAPTKPDACDGVDNNCDLLVDNGTTNDGAYIGAALYPSIQMAIDAAVDGDTISICRGTYSVPNDVYGKGVKLTSLTGIAADVTLLGTLTVQEAPASTTTLSKLQFKNATGMGVAVRNTKIVVEDCRFEGNNAGEGSALRVSASPAIPVSLRVARSQFIDNTSTDSGPAIGVYAPAGGSQITITDSTFKNNTATKATGAAKGAFAIEAVSVPQGASHAVNIVGSTFENNAVTSTNGALAVGGAVFANLYGSVMLTNSTFKNNIANDGGAAAFWPLTGGLNVKVTGSTFEGNMAANRGGALWLPTPNTYSRLELDGSTLTANIAGVASAAVEARSEVGNANGDVSFFSTTTMWGGDGDVPTNNVPRDLLINCGTNADVTADVSCF